MALVSCPAAFLCTLACFLESGKTCPGDDVVHLKDPSMHQLKLFPG